MWLNVSLSDHQVSNIQIGVACCICLLVDDLITQALWIKVNHTRAVIFDHDLATVEVDGGQHALGQLIPVALTTNCTNRWVMTDLLSQKSKLGSN